MQSEVVDSEERRDGISKVTSLVQQFAPSAIWQVDTLLELLKLNGDTGNEEVLSTLVDVVSHEDDALASYTVWMIDCRVICRCMCCLTTFERSEARSPLCRLRCGLSENTAICFSSLTTIHLHLLLLLREMPGIKRRACPHRLISTLCSPARSWISSTTSRTIVIAAKRRV